VLADALTVERRSRHLCHKRLSGYLVVIHSTEMDYNLLQGIVFYTNPERMDEGVNAI